MNKFLDKLVKLEKTISEEKGAFDLFAVFLREDGFDKWDLVASALWIEKDYNKAQHYVTRKLQSTLTTDELLKISKVVLIDEFDERVRSIQRVVRTEHNPVELRENNFFGLKIDLVYVITSKLQADKRLKKLIWEVLVEMWERGERTIYTGDVLEALKKRGEKVSTGAMRRVFESLLSSRCIRAAKFIDRDDIREHGAMAITGLYPNCPEIES